MSDTTTSAGAIVISYLDEKPMVVLVEHKDNTYVFPKGHVEAGETEAEAARREVLEETGIRIENFQTRVGVIERTKDQKTIAMYACTIPYPTKYEGHEEVFKWFSLEDALKVMRYEEDAKFLEQHWPTLIAG